MRTLQRNKMTVQRPNKRPRLLKACKSCRQLKKKCDGLEPCSYCSRYDHVCLYEVQQSPSLHTPVRDTDEQVRPIIASLTATMNQGDDNRTENSILDPEKRRYFDSSSAIAFPRLLGMQLGAVKAPRLHSFAWNLGLRSERPPKTPDITQLVSLNDVHVHSNEFFTFINPVFDMLDETEFRRRISLRWKSSAEEAERSFDAVICGVVALGCFCSYKSDNNTETTLVASAKDILEDAGLTMPPSIDLTAAWILRAIYLRMASRPHASWMASNIIMHLIEASGIHHEVSSVAIIYPPAGDSLLDESRASYRRRIFWIGRALHNILSYEYSRPRINIQNITSVRIDINVSAATKGLLQLADILPANTRSCKDEVDVVETKSTLQSLIELSFTGVPLSLFAADMAFAAYRHIRSYIVASTSTSDSTIPHLISVGTTALHAIKDHVLDKISAVHSGSRPVVAPWWCLISTPFHYILILLSIDTPESLANVPFALQILQEVATVFDSHMTREAVQNAAMLVRLSRTRKEGDIRLLKQALDLYSGNRRVEAQTSALPRQDITAVEGVSSNSTAAGKRPTRNTNNYVVEGRGMPVDELQSHPSNPFAASDVFDSGFDIPEVDNLDVSWDELCQYLDWT